MRFISSSTLNSILKMKWLVQSILIYLIYTCSVQGQSIFERPGPRVVCYVRSVGFERNFQLGNASLPCTHLIYSSVLLSEDGLAEPSQQDKENLIKINSYNDTTRPVYLMAQIGGDYDRSKFSEMTSDPEKRKKLVDSIVKITTDFKLHGVDLNWRFPQEKDKRTFLSLLQELRDEFGKKETISQLKLRGLTSIVLPNTREALEAGYKLLSISPVVDFMNVLTYNMVSASSPWLNHHASLNPVEFKDGNVDYIMKIYRKAGAPTRQLVMGLPLFGRKFIVDVVDNTTVHNTEMVSYSEICENLQSSNGWTKTKINGNAFISNDDEIISYDDIDNIGSKARLAKDLKLGGVMFWSLDLDDWKVTCSGVKMQYPLINFAWLIVNPPGVEYHEEPGKVPEQTLPPPVQSVKDISIQGEEGSTVNDDYDGTKSNPHSATNGPFQQPSLPSHPKVHALMSPFSFSSHPLQPGTVIVRVGGDIVLEDTFIEVNENHWPRKSSNT